MNSENPYRAPGAVVADQDRQAGSPVKGVVYGLLVDIVGTTLAGIVFAFVYGIVLAMNGASQQEIERAVTQIDPVSGVGLVALALGCAFSFLGGYVCARVAARSELKYAAIVGALSVAFGIAISAQAYSAALNVFLSAVGFASVMLGGYVGARRNAARA